MKGNRKVLDENTLNLFEDKFSVYSMKNLKDEIVVETKKIKLKTLKPISGFNLLVDDNGEKKYLRITSLAIDLWKKYFEGKYSIFKVQNTINFLQVISEDVNDENISKTLSEENAFIK